MLESLGVECSLAENGHEALDRLQQEAFGLVLMDCQMPGMDGLEATAQIRAWQRDGLLPGCLPIVALTANAVEGDRERCLAAGMDDYLSKPFTREHLAATLQRWLPESLPAATTAAAPTHSATPDETATSTAGGPIDPCALNAIRQLPGPNGPLLVNKVIDAYLADTPARLAQMRTAADTGDAAALRKAAHAMKSSSANVGAEKLAALCRTLEGASRHESADDAKTLLEKVESEIPRVLAALETILAENSENARS